MQRKEITSISEIVDESVTRSNIFKNEYISFDKNEKVVFTKNSILGLAGAITIDSMDDTISWSSLGGAETESSVGPNCEIFVVPFQKLSEIYNLKSEDNTSLVAELALYKTTQQLLDGERIKVDKQDSIIFKDKSKSSGELGADIARFNYAITHDGKYLESVVIEQTLKVQVGEVQNLNSYLRRGRNLVHLVPEHDKDVHQWANNFELKDFMPKGYALPLGMRMDYPYNSLHNHSVVLHGIKKAGSIEIEVSASALDGDDGVSNRFGVRYMGELICCSPVTLKPMEIDKKSDLSLHGDLENDPSVFGIEFDGSTPSNRQSLAIFRIVIDPKCGNIGLAYIQPSDLGSRIGSSHIEYTPVLPAKPKIKCDEDKEERIVYDQATAIDSELIAKEEATRALQSCYARLLGHAKAFKVGTGVAPKKESVVVDHPALMFRI